MGGAAEFWLVSLAAIGLRDFIHNLTYRFLMYIKLENRIFVWKSYNPVFFSFALQHGLAHLFFAAVGICCLLLAEGVLAVSDAPFIFDNITAIFFQQFIWDVSIFFRDHESFSPAFQKFYYAHHLVSMLIGVVFHLTGVFDALQGRLGFWALIFLSTSFTSSIGFMMRMFMRRGKLFFQIDSSLSVIQHSARLALFLMGFSECGMGKFPITPQNTIVTVAGLIIEAVDLHFHWKRFRNNQKEARECEENEKIKEKDTADNDGKDIVCSVSIDSTDVPMSEGKVEVVRSKTNESQEEETSDEGDVESAPSGSREGERDEE